MAKSPRAASSARRRSQVAATVPVGEQREGSCRYCKASIRPDYNYCAHCGMPTDPAHDRPLFVIEGLTNLFNVVFFESLLEQELNRAIRYGYDVSVIVVEVDDLQALEAAYGYEEANRIIREVGESIANA